MSDRPDLMTVIAARAIDLRAEFEAQMRSVTRVERQLRQTRAGGDPEGRALERVLRRELTEMLANNRNILNVLNELAGETQAPAASPEPCE